MGEIKRYDSAPRSSRVVIHDGVVYFGGHGARPEFKTITEQTEALLARMEELFDQYGTDKEHLLTATLYLADMSLFDEMNAVWDRWIPEGCAPTRACVEAKMSQEYLLLEAVFTAAQVREPKEQVK